MVPGDAQQDHVAGTTLSAPAGGASDRDREIAIEQAHVDVVTARVDELRREATVVRDEQLVTIDKDHAGSVYERDVMVNSIGERLRVLELQSDGLVFGRLDTAEGEQLRVGRIGVRTANSDVLVVDWRAPAASAFYSATEVRPEGVARRRVITSRGDRVLDVDDEVLDAEAAERLALPTIGGGALMAALRRSRDDHMHDIVATIQREQDEAIRYPATGVVLIDGGPGTGKTVVALHRAAYLLHANRDRYRSSGVLVVGPTAVFSRYIERVLPSLGETTAALLSVGELADGISGARYDDVAAEIKGSDRMVPILRDAMVAALPAAPPRFYSPALHTTVMVDRTALGRVKHEVAANAARSGGSYDKMVRAVARMVLREYRRHQPDPVELGQLALDDPEPDGSSLPQQRPVDVEDLLTDDGFLDFVDAVWPQQKPVDILDRLRDRRVLEAATRTTLNDRERRLLLESWSRPGWSTHDVALADELRFLVGDLAAPRIREDDELADAGYEELSTFADRNRRNVAAREDDYSGYAHVIVDEAQDITPMQWRALGRRGRRATWTIVGDPAQRSWDDRAQAEEARRAATGGKAEKRFLFDTNYRTPAEAVALADEVLRRIEPRHRGANAVRSTGRQPEVVDAAGDLDKAVVRAVTALLSEVDGTVGVVGPVAATPRLAELVSPVNPARVRCVSSLEAKGLEFDGVVVVSPGALAAEAATGVRRLYVALTRATQRLIVVAPDAADLEAAGLSRPRG
jgi:DNA helicase IV